MTTTALPPTFNLLDQTQRVRLMLTTRKLGQVLGSTPFVLDPSASSHLSLEQESKKLPENVKALRRQGICHSPSSSASSLETFVNFTIACPTTLPYTTPKAAAYMEALPKESKKSTSRPRGKTDTRPPFLQLSSNTTFTLQASISGSQIRRASLPSPTLFSPSHKRANSTPTTPLTPSFLPVPIDEPAERRKKMAKVSRTLGETIPTELVFRGSSPQPDPTLSTKASSISLISKTPSSTRSKGHRRRSSTISVPSSKPHGIHLALPSDAPFGALVEHDDTPLVVVDECDEVDLFLEGASSIVQHDWTGEWNLKDMEQVQKGLRALRL